MNYTFSDMPTDENLEAKSRLTIDKLMDNADPRVQLEAARVAKTEFLRPPEPQGSGLLRVGEGMMTALLKSIGTSLPQGQGRLLEADDCRTVRIEDPS